MKNISKTKAVNIRMSPDMYDQVESVAKANDMTVSELVRASLGYVILDNISDNMDSSILRMAYIISEKVEGEEEKDMIFSTLDKMVLAVDAVAKTALVVQERAQKTKAFVDRLHKISAEEMTRLIAELDIKGNEDYLQIPDESLPGGNNDKTTK